MPAEVLEHGPERDEPRSAASYSGGEPQWLGAEEPVAHPRRAPAPRGWLVGGAALLVVVAVVALGLHGASPAQPTANPRPPPHSDPGAIGSIQVSGPTVGPGLDLPLTIVGDDDGELRRIDLTTTGAMRQNAVVSGLPAQRWSPSTDGRVLVGSNGSTGYALPIDRRPEPRELGPAVVVLVDPEPQRVWLLNRSAAGGWTTAPVLLADGSPDGPVVSAPPGWVPAGVLDGGLLAVRTDSSDHVIGVLDPLSGAVTGTLMTDAELVATGPGWAVLVESGCVPLACTAMYTRGTYDSATLFAPPPDGRTAFARGEAALRADGQQLVLSGWQADPGGPVQEVGATRVLLAADLSRDGPPPPNRVRRAGTIPGTATFRPRGGLFYRGDQVVFTVTERPGVTTAMAAAVIPGGGSAVRTDRPLSPLSRLIAPAP